MASCVSRKLHFAINGRARLFTRIAAPAQFSLRDFLFSQRNRVFAAFVLLIIAPASQFGESSRGPLKFIFTYRGKTTRSLVYMPSSARLSSPSVLSLRINLIEPRRSKKIIGAGRLFKIRGPRIVSGSQSYRNFACVFTSLKYTACYYSEFFIR